MPPKAVLVASVLAIVTISGPLGTQSNTSIAKLYSYIYTKYTRVLMYLCTECTNILIY